jgi:hypothetical protein
MTAFANEVHDGPTILATLKVVESEVRQLPSRSGRPNLVFGRLIFRLLAFLPMCSADPSMRREVKSLLRNAVSCDGQRFLVNLTADEGAVLPITLISPSYLAATAM